MPNPVLDSEIAQNIRKIEPHVKIICALIKNCANCSIFEHCMTRMVEASGITEDMLIDSLYNRIMECHEYETNGMCWNISLSEGK